MANYKDVGFGEKYDSKEKRLINKDGSFNVIKRGSISKLRDVHTFIRNALGQIYLIFP